MARSSKRVSETDERSRGGGDLHAGFPAEGPREHEGTESIDAILGGLEHVVKELESGELPLERALVRFEEGVRLARRGSALLDAVEERIEMLLRDRDEVVPLANGEGGNEDEPADDDDDAPF